MHSSRKLRGAVWVFLVVILAVSLASSGCAGSVSSAPAPVSSTPPPTGAPQLSVNPTSVTVNASVGVMSSQPVTASNAGTAALNVSQVQVTGTGFALSGLSAPFSLAPGAAQNFTVTFDATASGSVDGTLSLMTNASASPIIIPLHGSASVLVISVAIFPAAPQAIVSSTLPFSASVQGATTNTAVTWKASRGSITAAGVYTAPATTGTDTVTATSVADTTKSASAAVTVIGAPTTPTVTSVTLTPASASLNTGATMQFSASVQGTGTDKSVTWKAASGVITTGGFYTASATAGTDTITATSNADNTKSASATVTVTASVVNAVSVSPATASALTGGTVQFSASVAGTVTDKSVTWKAVSGAISAAGLYTAPAKAGTDTVTATSNADNTKSASSSVTVSAPVVNSVSISPTTASILTSGKQQLTATVAGTVSDRSVSWKASAGTITTSGAYTAAATAGTATVTATSNADATKSASATITVAAPVINSVSVSPATTSLATGGTAQFTATVSGTNTNKSVTWKAALGTITTAGAYTAPASAGTDTITATSAADTTKSGTASVTVSAPVVNSVSITPSAISVTTGGTSQFSATVSGTVSDKTVTWSAASGTISAGGVYVAPSKAGTDTVTATSDADPSKSATATVNISAPVNNGQLPAFPGAQGGGGAAVGGRGGQVIEVTNLQDSGTGSLRACIEASGPRTCVFRVSGLITFRSRAEISHPFLTIAGQTAPGGGIVIGGPNQSGEQLFVITHDVVVRYLTYDGNNPNVTPGPNSDNVCCEMATGDVYNVIWDHMTARWMVNKAFPTVSNTPGTGIHNTTIQWSLVYEPNFNHSVGIGTVYVSQGSGMATTDDDAHHNMFATIDHRLPLNQSGRNVRWVNNLIYNWGQFGALSMGGVQTDYIGNKYVDGAGGDLNYENVHVFLANGNGDDPSDQTGSPNGDNEHNPTMYLLNNLGHAGNKHGGPLVAITHTPNDAAQVSMTAQGWEGGETGDPNSTGPWPSSWFRSTPLPTQKFPIVADPVENLDDVLLPTVGNSQHLDCNGNWVSNRDSQDTRIINVYKNGQSDNLFNGQFSAPSIPAGTPCTESLHDGIPDQWKVNHGLSTTDPNLHKAVAPSGTTYLENYLNGNQ